MKIFSILCLLCMSLLAEAEVFKCTDRSGKTLYQAEPCQRSAQEKQLQINKSTPLQEEAAKARLQELELEYDENQVKRQEAEKYDQEQKNQAAIVDAIKQNAAAQRQWADAVKNQADTRYQPGYGGFLSFPYGPETGRHHHVNPEKPLPQQEYPPEALPSFRPKIQSFNPVQQPMQSGPDLQEQRRNEQENRRQPAIGPVYPLPVEVR